MANVYGYRRDPAEKVAQALKFATDLKPKLVTVSTGDVDLRGFCTDTNQLQLSACAGNATADSIEILGAIEEDTLAKSEGREPQPQIQVARLYIYSMARDEHDEIDKDEGTYISTCFDVLSRFGVCDETVWPYDESKVYVRPSIKALRQATGHKIHSYYRIEGTGDDRIDEVISALRADHPVVFGTDINEKVFNEYDGSYVLTPPAHSDGGHAMIIVGWLSKINAFIVKNSWGGRWGDKGFAYFSTDYIKWARTTDLWVPTKGTNLAF
jgi:hypothetical protein